MTVAELIKALQALPGEMPVCVINERRDDLDEASVDTALQPPDGAAVRGRPWRWEDSRDGPEWYTERVAVVY